jgi:hypothetical protein
MAKHPHRLYSGERMRRESPASEPEHTASYRFGVVIEGAGRKILGSHWVGKCSWSVKNAVAEQPRKVSCD